MWCFFLVSIFWKIFARPLSQCLFTLIEAIYLEGQFIMERTHGVNVDLLGLSTKRWPSLASPVPVLSWGSDLHISYHTMPRMEQKFFPSIMESFPRFPKIAALVASLCGVIGKPWYSFLRIIYYGLVISLPFQSRPTPDSLPFCF